ncbi:MAG: DMT family transporter [Bacteroidales bacterium]|nr:DMT family transporter [Bacteroidales bacterium]MCF8405658.1 DMT family transporter [Bacteroidales bacterium]
MEGNNRFKGVLFASITALFWGFLVIALKVATGIIDPLTIVWFRFLVAFTALAFYFSITKPSYLKILKNPPLYLIVASLGLGINYLGYLYGLKLTTASTSQVIIQIGPILLGVVGLVIFKEKISQRQAFGFLLAGIGLFIFYRESISQLVENEDMFNMGVIWIVVAAMAWVVYATLQKILVKTYPAPQLNLFIFGLPVLLFLPFIKIDGFLHLSIGNWILMVYLGLNTLIAYGSLALAFKYLEANKVSMIITLNPIITFISLGILGYLEVSWIEPEILTTKGIIAALLVLTGAIMAVAFTSNKKKKELKELIPNPKK